MPRDDTEAHGSYYYRRVVDGVKDVTTPAWGIIALYMLYQLSEKVDRVAEAVIRLTAKIGG